MEFNKIKSANVIEKEKSVKIREKASYILRSIGVLISVLRVFVKNLLRLK